MMVAFGLFFLIGPFVLPLKVEGILAKLGLALAGAVILGVEAWSWKRRRALRDEQSDRDR